MTVSESKTNKQTIEVDMNKYEVSIVAEDGEVIGVYPELVSDRELEMVMVTGEEFMQVMELVHQKSMKLVSRLVNSL